MYRLLRIIVMVLDIYFEWLFVSIVIELFERLSVMIIPIPSCVLAIL